MNVTMNAIIDYLTLCPIDLRATSSHFDVSTPTIHMVAGVTAGFFSTTLTHPFDMLKTRMQLKPAEYKNVLQAARKVLMVRPLILILTTSGHFVITRVLFNWILIQLKNNVHETITQNRRRVRLDSWTGSLSGQCASRFILQSRGQSTRKSFGGMSLERQIISFEIHDLP